MVRGIVIDGLLLGKLLGVLLGNLDGDIADGIKLGDSVGCHNGLSVMILGDAEDIADTGSTQISHAT